MKSKQDRNRLRFVYEPDLKAGLNWIGLVSASLLILGLIGVGPPGALRASAADTSTSISAIARPAAGFTQILFHGTKGPYLVQTRSTLDPRAAWVDVTDALVTEVETGVFIAYFGNGKDDMGFYRVVSPEDPSSDLVGWTILVKISSPANGAYFVQGESPVVSVTILDNFAQGLSRTSFSTLGLYMYGPQDPKQTVTAVKLLNASTDRTKTPHHYIDLRSNPAVKVNGNTLTYPLQPVTDELPGTYTVSVSATLDSDKIQQIMRLTNVQIGSGQVESPVVAKTSCAACHLGTISGHMYMHHVDPGRSPTGSFALDLAPVDSCKSCHNNNGYAAYSDASVPGGKVPDPIIRRVHGVHMGEGLSSDFNTNSVTGDFKDYTKLVFPADVRNCTKCHVDDRWLTQPSIASCGACHDNTWFGPKAQLPSGMEAHPGGALSDDRTCAICHTADSTGLSPVADAHRIEPPAIDAIDVTMTPPANGAFYVAGEKPVITLVFKDDKGNPLTDHTQVTDANFSTASLFVYGPRTEALPVLTSTARNVNSKLRASVTSSKAGPWDINGKTFRIAINGSAPQDIKIVGASSQVTPAEVVATLNPVIGKLNGGAKASVSGSNVNIKTLIQGDDARIEIYNGEVTTAMGWKRGPNTVLDPDVTVAAASIPANDLRALSDPLDYSDPMVNRGAGSITYQLDDVAGLIPGTYNVYVYHLPKAGKIAGLNAPVGLGHLNFQIGTKTVEPKIATNCSDCHGDTTFHFSSGPIHPAPFNTDYCTACHDYSHTSTGEMFKNQGGTSLNGWSGFGAMPIVRRVHGVHYAHYLEHSEEIYANATKETFGGIIFPQDVRNCTKCHAESDAWKEKPSRLACLACHDTDEAKAHGKIMTYIPDPQDPYGPSAVESCEVCHGPDAEFSPDKVHRISSPFVPPYPREPKEP